VIVSDLSTYTFIYVYVCVIYLCVCVCVYCFRREKNTLGGKKRSVCVCVRACIAKPAI
jgi:hypothetical protein